jgi:hypothetical protein
MKPERKARKAARLTAQAQREARRRGLLLVVEGFPSGRHGELWRLYDAQTGRLLLSYQFRTRRWWSGQNRRGQLLCWKESLDLAAHLAGRAPPPTPRRPPSFLRPESAAVPGGAEGLEVAVLPLPDSPFAVPPAARPGKPAAAQPTFGPSQALDAPAGR